MTFNSIVFMLFLAIVLLLYYILPGKARNLLLLIASYVFYANYSVPLVLFLVICTLVAYVIARRMESASDKGRKGWLAFGVILNVGALAFYKYTNFMLGMIGASEYKLSLMAPLGISFIIFTTISYLIDVYRKKIPAEKRILRFALYVGFFPKVVQGPIAKAEDMLPQFDAVAEKKAADWDKLKEGFLMVLYGLFMKMVIADRLAVAVNTLYVYPKDYSGAALLFGTFLFALQIYFDFAGYSLTAIGAAKMFGIDMKDNFRQPYLSKSVGEFWRRWHISLNQWLTDYVYIPLGGSRCSKARATCNTLITFGLSGLWHGANWGYVIWGLLNGAYVVIEKRVQEFRQKRLVQPADCVDAPKKARSGFGSFVTFLLVSFAWIFFRAESLGKSLTIVKRILLKFNLGGFLRWSFAEFGAEEASFLGLTSTSWIVLLVCLVFAGIVDIIAKRYPLANKVATGKMGWRWLVLLVLLFAVIMFGMYGYGYSAGAFIYAQF